MRLPWVLCSLGDVCCKREQYAQAESFLERSLEIREAKLRPNDADLAQSLHNLAKVYGHSGRHGQAEQLLKRCINIRKAALGRNHPDLGKSLNNLAGVYHRQQQFDKAKPLYQESIRIEEAHFGRDHIKTVINLQNLAYLYDDMGEYAQAEPFYQRCLEIYEKALGPDHPSVATALANLASDYKSMGEYERAAPLLERSLKIRQAKLGPDNVEVADTLARLANLYSALAQYSLAQPLHERSIEIYEAKLESDHPSLALALNNLGNLFQLSGNYAKAEPLLRRSIEIYERKFGPEDLGVAWPLNNLGALYGEMGQYAEAESLLLRCLKIRESKLGPDHPTVANTLNSLAIVYFKSGQHARAEPLYLRCLEIDEAKLGPEHNELATDLQNLAHLYDEMHRVGEAETLYKRCLKIREATLGPTHPLVASTLNNLANLYLNNGDYVRAEPLYQRTLTIQQRTLSAEHPDVINTLNNLALLYVDMGRAERAADMFDRERRSVRRHVVRTLPVLGTQEQLAFIKRTDEKHFHLALAFGRLHSDEPAWAELSASWLINGKAVVQASLAEHALLARDSEDLPLQRQVAELIQVRTKIAGLSLAAPKMGEESARLARLGQLAADERNLARQINLAGGLAMQDEPWIETSAVRQALRSGSVLVEIARFRPKRLRSKRGESHWLPARYVAWTIPPTGAGDVRVIDLGEADEIDLAVAHARITIEHSAPGIEGSEREDAAERTALEPLRALAKLVLEPLLPALKDVQEIVLSPDSQLWLAPWAALPVQDRQYAIERWRIRYVTTGRDLVLPKLVAKASKRHAPTRPMVFADPDYDLSGPSREAAVRAVLQGRDVPRRELVASPRADSDAPKAERLPGTAEEARLITPSLERLAHEPPTVYVGPQALEDVLKTVRSPRVLVLSTHGFYLPAPLADDDHPLENPLLRCGLLLAGCNVPAAGSHVDDGVVTGMEIVGCDLRGAELVVLSACQTGLGQVHNGEGVAGLRQAFQLAGAKAVVSTLWRIPDAETVALMGDFFEELAAGRDKAEALRSAQVTQINARRSATGGAHPLFWAAFTLTGN